MRLPFKHITAISLAFMVWTSTVGFNLHVLYCFCLDEWKISLFDIADQMTCGTEKKVSNCCKSHANCGDVSKQVLHKPPCKASTIEYVKINDKFLPSKDHQGFPSKDFDRSATVPPLSVVTFWPHYPHLYINSNKAPPLPYGKNLLTKIQVMTC